MDRGQDLRVLGANVAGKDDAVEFPPNADLTKQRTWRLGQKAELHSAIVPVDLDLEVNEAEFRHASPACGDELRELSKRCRDVDRPVGKALVLVVLEPAQITFT